MDHHHRGRSRHVSPVALARQASEERRLSLADQIQVAYAHDNIRLAKTLLLQLNGVHVTDDADPRIDQVRDEDFDVCFAPAGPLVLTDADMRAVQDSQRRLTRAQRLSACERLWQVKSDQKPRKVPVSDPSRARPRPTKSHPDPPLPPKRVHDPFQYTFMPPCTPSPRSAKKPLAPSASRHRTVSFQDVLDAMNGTLFPLDPSERADDARRIAGLPIANPSSHRRKASVRADLLDTLLHVVEWHQAERRIVKGKHVDRTPQSPVPPPTPILSVPSSISLSSSRSSSWLSFGSWRSTATDITTPDSPILLSPPPSQPCLLPTLVENLPDIHPRSAFVRISLQDTPLCPPMTSPVPLYPCLVPTPTPNPSPGLRGALVNRVTRSVATIVGAAKGLQSAYITATMFSAGAPYSVLDTPPQPRQSSRCQRPVRREGYRALAKDVRRFTDTPTQTTQTCEPVHFIPLVSPPAENPALSKPPVPKDALIFPSPLRPRTPPAALAYRMRPVANPAVLRLRALQNLMCARGKEWEGRAREGGLGCGKERMLGIAFEGRGRSGLGCEVRYVVA